jgi:hypothetical protein
MKKCFILLLILCLLLAGCARQQTSLITTLKFYYPLQVADYTLGASYIQPELREGAGVDKSLKNMLNLYLKGPKDQITFQMPFRYNTQVVSISRGSTMLDITLNRGFANYTGLDLTIACACITMTCMELTDVTVVRIRAENTTLDGAEFIEMSAESLLLVDFGKENTQ